MLTQKDIQLLQLSRVKRLKLGLWVLFTVASVSIVCGVLNLYSGGPCALQKHFSIIGNPDFYQEYPGYVLWAREKFLTGLMQVLVGAQIAFMGVIAFVTNGRYRRFLAFLEENNPELLKGTSVPQPASPSTTADGGI